MIINTDGNNPLPNMPKLVKRGFNQTPSDIRDRMIASEIALKKQQQIMKNKENDLNNTLDASAKVDALKKINKGL